MYELATHRVAAGVYTQLGSHGNGAAEPEENIEDIHDQGQHGVDLERLLDGGGDEVQQGEHAKDGNEEGVVDDAGVVAVGVGDHVADQGHDEKGPEEL